MKRAYFAFMSAILLFSCQTTSYTSPDNYPGKQVMVSAGGGVTGQTEQYIILENGQVFNRTIYPAGLKEEGKIKKGEIKDLFERINMLNISGIGFNHPGNMTYTLSYNDGQQVYEVKWGDPAYQAPSQVLDLYNFIRDLINQ